MIQVASNASRLARILCRCPVILNSERVQSLNAEAFEVTQSPHLWRINDRSFSSRAFWSSEIIHESHVPLALNNRQSILLHPTSSMMSSRALFSSEASATEGSPTEVVKELYDKMLKSVVDQRTAPPNAWLWSLIENCANHEDIKLLFDILQNLRRFRLSHLRIHENFNCNLCLEITKACARVGAIDFGKKALWKHNVHGLTPSIASAHTLLLYAKQKNDANLMVEIMKLLKVNGLPLQPGTADIVFSICYNTGNWGLISKYSKRFVKAGVKLRPTSFDTWMQFAAKLGDVDSLWKIEKLRSNIMKMHTIGSGFSCAKGFLLERKPNDAAAILQVLNQTLPDAKRPHIMAELQKLVSEWPLEVIKHRKEESGKALAVALQDDIPVMVNALLGFGLEVNVDMEDLTKKDLLC